MPRKTHKKLRGGKLLGQGTYGCAFKPSLVCRGERGPREGTISKMISNEKDASDEYNISQAILRIDPARKYFITALDKCLHDGMSRNNSINSRGRPCQFKFDRGQNYLIFYPMGGETSDSIRIRPDKYASAIKGFRNLLEGILVLHNANMAHLDIKSDNILSIFSDGEYKTRFIDFGLSESNTTVLTPTSEKLFTISYHLYTNIHYWYPIDAVLMDGHSKFLHDPPYTSSQFIQKWYNLINRIPYYPESSFFYYNNKIRYPKITYETFMEQFNNNRRYYADTNKVIKTVDITALGIAFANMYSRLTGHYSRIEPYTNKDSIAIIIRTGYNPVLISLLNVGSFGGQQDVFDWHMDLANNFSIRMYDLITKMMNYNGPQRLTAGQALDLFDSFIGDIDRYFENVELTKRALTTIGIQIDNTPLPEPRVDVPVPPAIGKQQVAINPYEILGIAEDADESTIKKAYRKLALEHHPNKGGDREKFELAEDAYKYAVLLLVAKGDNMEKALDAASELDKRKQEMARRVAAAARDRWNPRAAARAFPIGREHRGVDAERAAAQRAADERAAEAARRNAQRAAAEQARRDAERIAAERAAADARGRAEKAAADRAAAEKAATAAAEVARRNALLAAEEASLRSKRAREEEERAAKNADFLSRLFPGGPRAPQPTKAVRTSLANEMKGISKPPLPEPAMPVPLPAWLQKPVANPADSRPANMAARAANVANKERARRLATAYAADAAAAKAVAGYNSFDHTLGLPTMPIRRAPGGMAGEHAAGLQPYPNPHAPRPPLGTLGQTSYQNSYAKILADAAARRKEENAAAAHVERLRKGGLWGGARRTRKQKRNNRL